MMLPVAWAFFLDYSILANNSTLMPNLEIYIYKLCVKCGSIEFKSLLIFTAFKWKLHDHPQKYKMLAILRFYLRSDWIQYSP